MTLPADDLPPSNLPPAVAVRTWRDDIPATFGFLAVTLVAVAALWVDPWLAPTALIAFAFTGGEWR